MLYYCAYTDSKHLSILHNILDKVKLLKTQVIVHYGYNTCPTQILLIVSSYSLTHSFHIKIYGYIFVFKIMCYVDTVLRKVGVEFNPVL